MENINYNEKYELTVLCEKVREFINQKRYCECEDIIANAMMKYPHAPEPHNLMGIKLEVKGEHSAAMKHFRAAWALDPTYLPARYNLNQYGDMFCKEHKNAYVESDCPLEDKSDLYKTEYDENGIAHIVKRINKMIRLK